MKKSHWRFVAVLAIVVFAAVSTASASAAVWHVGGAELKGTDALTLTAPIVEKIKIESIGLAEECSSEQMELKGASITTGAGGKIEHLVFNGCKSNVSQCPLSSTKIETKPLTVTASLGKKSPEDTLLLKPTTGTVFAVYFYEGENCPLASEQVLKGTIKVILPKGQEEHAEMEFNPLSEGSELQGNSASVSLRGKAKVKLTSGLAWSFH